MSKSEDARYDYGPSEAMHSEMAGEVVELEVLWEEQWVPQSEALVVAPAAVGAAVGDLEFHWGMFLTDAYERLYVKLRV